jgi:aldehyde dehydrogenase (NAD+)
LLHKKIYAAFVERFLGRVKTLRVGNGLDPQVDMGPSINRMQLEKVEKYVGIGKEEGATLLCGGHRLTGGSFDHGNFFEPTVFGDVRRDMRIAREEIFGPVVSLIPAGDLEEAISICNDTVYGLSSAIYTNNVDHAFRAMRDLVAGITYINAPTIGAEVHLPFGGVKQTGNGHREGGPTVIDLFTEWKTIYVDFSGKLQKAQIDS